jgi:prenylcysteine oxidase/farnesylcysteine lyase
VTDIISVGSEEQPKYRIDTDGESIDNGTVYDAVFFAAPWHLSPISKSISADFHEQIPYVHLSSYIGHHSSKTDEMM